MSVDVGPAVPNFTCIADDENPRSLSAEAGNWVVVFFYPKASTPGCTIESKDFLKSEFAWRSRPTAGEFDALADELHRLGLGVGGVGRLIACAASATAPARRPSSAARLTVPLLADEDQVVHAVFGTWQEKNYGRTYMGTVRST